MPTEWVRVSFYTMNLLVCIDVCEKKLPCGWPNPVYLNGAGPAHSQETLEAEFSVQAWACGKQSALGRIMRGAQFHLCSKGSAARAMRSES